MRRPLEQSSQTGLTLLELLLVITVLSTMAFLTVAEVSEGASQARLEDTDTRLGVVRRALIGSPEPIYDGVLRFSGFASDNGVLPPSATWEDFLQDASAAVVDDYQAFGPQSPRFDPVPDSTAYNDGTGETELSGANEVLQKGWRGPYARLGSLAGANFVDGWGNAWSASATTSGDDLTVTSLGRDAAVGDSGTDVRDPGNFDYDSDRSTAVALTDWRVDSAGWSVDVRNASSSAVAPGGCLRATLLIFRNADTTGTNGLWRRLTSTCVDFAGGSTLPAGETVSVTFDNADYDVTGGSLSDVTVPQGRHLLLLIDDDDDTDKHSIGGAPAPYITAVSTSRVSAHVNFFARAALPSPTLVITD
ncbi:MAG: hypothetical protein AAF458_09770 [Pseudomonadota bacterium]